MIKIIITYTNDRTIYHTDKDAMSKHRVNGPASIWHRSGMVYWYLRGKQHRYYGPQSSSADVWIVKGEIIKSDEK